MRNEKVEARLGMTVIADGWQYSRVLVETIYQPAQFQVVMRERPFLTYSAVDVKVTGRKDRLVPGYNEFGRRCQITFHDGFGGTSKSGGWLFV